MKKIYLVLFFLMALTANIAMGQCVNATVQGAWVNTAFAVDNTNFAAEFDATPMDSAGVPLSNLLIGLSSGSQSAFGAFAILLRFTDSVITARNGENGGYVSDTKVYYKAGTTYHFRVLTNVKTKTYTVFVTPQGGSEILLVANNIFRAQSTKLNSYGAYVDLVGFGRGSLQICNFAKKEWITAKEQGAWVNQPFASQNGTFAADFDATPRDSAGVPLSNLLIGLSSGSQSAFGAFAILIRFLDDTIKVRNGENGGYVFDTPVRYKAGTTYHFHVEVDATAKTYSVYVTPKGQNEVLLAANKAFRAQSTSLSNYAAYVDLVGYGKGILEVGNFVATNVGDVAPTQGATVPTDYTLNQNYPNPFNPSTKISYNLPATSNVKLVVFDLLGREIATLVNGVQTAGLKTVEFNARSLASGMYFYRITAGNFTQIKKMVFVK